MEKEHRMNVVSGMMVVAALCLFSYADGLEQARQTDEWLLPCGTLTAFAEYMPAYKNAALPGRETKRIASLERALDIARAAKDAPALAEAAGRLDAYWQGRMDELYAPVAAWLTSRWFVEAELIPERENGRAAYEKPDQEWKDEVVLKSWAEAQGAWLIFLRADEIFYRAYLLIDQQRRAKRDGLEVSDDDVLGDLEEAEVLVHRALKKMERVMAIANTGCATNAYSLVGPVPVDPGWQENDPVLRKIERAVCTSEYPFVKNLVGDYNRYWETRLSVIRIAFFAEHGVGPGFVDGMEWARRDTLEKLLNTADRAWKHYKMMSIEYEISPSISFWSSGINIYMTAHDTWLYRQRCRDMMTLAGLAPERRAEGFECPPRPYSCYGEARIALECKAAAGGPSAELRQKLAMELEKLRTDLDDNNCAWPAILLAVRLGEEKALRLLLNRGKYATDDFPDGARPPFMTALEAGNINMVRILCSSYNMLKLINEVDSRSRTAVDMARDDGYDEVVALLRRHGGLTGQEKAAEPREDEI